MNMRKSAFAAITTVAILSFSVGGQMSAADRQFKDLDNVSGKEKIISLKDQGLLKGASDTQFLPSSKVTAAQGIQLISGGLQLSLAAIDFNKAPQASGLFTHVKDTAWYAEAFINAHYNGVVIPKDIVPSKTLTKEEFTHMLIQGMEKAGALPMIKIAPANIADDSELEPSYQGSIQRSLVYKVNTLDASEKFHPKSEITRAEAAVMLYNALEYLNAHTKSS
ncbi:MULTISPECIES: S-layer homology domain-containing protein [Paenibacillus]|uniref:S-layer homology domain-containing protein n=2 Tax=Paenibacillus TaxID=44249 RepID=A0AAP4A047_PAEPO|nr:S-layer homology domain-containing protein [Paenibacillus polymyxa]AIW40691.1 amylopullulanase [Paenibacillus polymyxa CR1]APB75231.1 S-layer homology domain-containing protein [Paenibacillus polymyxa]MDH2330555.1 S-layer homology domain-containing protein [Paenibacillus polymyxa]POR27868.1 amylopullulanase [Paenibacillus polymyxa]